MLNCWRIVALTGLAACCACSDSTTDPIPEEPVGLPDDPPEFTIFDFDGYAGDQYVQFYWNSHIDWMPGSPIPPPLKEIKLWMSLTGPSQDFFLLRSRLGPGVDSTSIADLANGVSHYFRLTVHDSSDGVVAASRPIWVQPGPSIPPSIAIHVPQVLPDRATLQGNRNLDWSPDGKWLAFVKADNGEVANLYLLGVDDLSVKQLTHYTQGTLSSPMWSPSQDKLAFGGNNLSPLGWGARIWVTSLDGGEGQPIPNSFGDLDFAPCWISDDAILFCRGTSWAPNIPEFALVHLSDGIEQKLTFDQTIYKYNPVLSPTASVLAYSGYVSQVGGGILARSLWLFDLPSRHSHLLTENQYWDDTTPSWSPDGNQMLFASNRNGHFEIWSLDLVTREEKQVTRSPQHGFEILNAAISPDGSELAYFRSSSTESWLEIRPSEP